MFRNNTFKPLKALFFFGVFILFVGVLSWVVMFLWNAILPDTVGVKPLTYWKAMGLLVLSKILFGGFGRGRGSWKQKGRKKFQEKFQDKWQNKWMGMSEEERREAQQRWKNHCENKRPKNTDNQQDEGKD